MKIREDHFAPGGLNTSAGATGLPFMDCTVLNDMRVAGTDWLQRLGIAFVKQLEGGAEGMRGADFPGVNSYFAATVDARPWTLGLNWTLELAIEPDTTSGTQGILTVGATTPALIIDISSSNLRLRVWDSGATLTTVTIGAAATSVQTIQVTRSAATISTRLNNGTAVTGSMSATLNVRTPAGDLRIGRDDSTNYYDGTVDYVRLFSYTRTHHRDRLIRFSAPRAESVLADYDFNLSTGGGGLVFDRSRFEAHLANNNSVGEVNTLCHNPASVRAISMMVDENQTKQLLAVNGGGRYYLGSVS